MKPILTLDRIRIYALMTVIVGCTVAVPVWIKRPTLGTDFAAFYNAGRIINEGGDLYDQNLQNKLFHELAPEFPDDYRMLFAYTPFFALIFSPLATLPYSWAFGAWLLISFVLFTAGFRLIYSTSALPPKYQFTGYLIGLSFLPVFGWCLLSGQTSIFGIFALALAIYLDRERQFLSGLALALLLYKPPLLVLILAMLVITKRWWTLFGFAVGGVALGVISLAVIGFSGIPSYITMLIGFASSKTGHPTWHSVDAFSFFFSLTKSKSASYALLGSSAAAVVPFLFRSWKRRPETAWATALTWTLVLNLYVLLHDFSLIVLAVVLTLSALPRRAPKVLAALLIAMFLMPWVAKVITDNYGIQPLTPIIIIFGIYQLTVFIARRSCCTKELFGPEPHAEPSELSNTTLI